MIAIGLCKVEHLEKQLRVWVHGDDFVPLGYIINVKWFSSETARVLDCHEWRNPWTLWTDDGTWEADLRHAELIRKSFGVTGRSVATPGVRDKLNDIEGEVPIDKEAADRYRANTMRAQYLSSDRPEIQVECRDLARKMQQPPYLDEMGLKRLARFLGVRPRLVWLFKWQKRVTHRILVRHGPCCLYPNQEECFWLCVDAG